MLNIDHYVEENVHHDEEDKEDLMNENQTSRCTKHNQSILNPDGKSYNLKAPLNINFILHHILN